MAVAVPPPSATAAPVADAPVCPPPAPLTGLDLPAAIGCPFAASVVAVVAVPSGAELSATAGPWSVQISVLEGAGVPLTIVPGTRISISGTVDEAAGGQLAVTVDAGSIRIAG